MIRNSSTGWTDQREREQRRTHVNTLFPTDCWTSTENCVCNVPKNRLQVSVYMPLNNSFRMASRNERLFHWLFRRFVRNAHTLSFPGAVRSLSILRISCILLLDLHCLPYIGLWILTVCLCDSLSPPHTMFNCDVNFHWNDKWKLLLATVYLWATWWVGEKKQSRENCVFFIFYALNSYISRKLTHTHSHTSKALSAHVHSISVANKIKWKIVYCWARHVHQPIPNTKWIVTISNCRTVVRCVLEKKEDMIRVRYTY